MNKNNTDIQENTEIVENNEKSKNSKSKKIILIIISAVILVAAVIVGFIFLTPVIKYNVAISKSEKGEYAEAISLFDELGDYKDSKKLYIKTAEASKIADAKKLFDENKLIDGYNLLKEVKENEEVKALKAKYGPIIIENTTSNITKSESKDGKKLYFRNKDATKFSWGKSDPYFEIYIEKQKDIEDDFEIILRLDFLFDYSHKKGFHTPVHPVNLIFSDGTSSVSVYVNMLERFFDSTKTGWKEQVLTQINILKYRELVKLFSSGKEISVNVSGISKSIDFKLSKEKTTAATSHSDYVNALQVVYGVNEDIDVSKIKSEINQYEQSVGVMLGAVEVIEEIGISESYLKEFKKIYEHILTLEPKEETDENIELTSAVSRAYTSCINYYEYCLNPTVDMSGCPGDIPWAVSLYRNTFIQEYKRLSNIQKNSDIENLKTIIEK